MHEDDEDEMVRKDDEDDEDDGVGAFYCYFLRFNSNTKYLNQRGYPYSHIPGSGKWLYLKGNDPTGGIHFSLPRLWEEW